jgi:hypothetical protein
MISPLVFEALGITSGRPFAPGEDERRIRGHDQEVGKIWIGTAG